MEHPITARQSLVEKWLEEAMDQGLTAYALAEYIATQAARWGADKELEACCAWIADNSLHHADSDLLKDLRAARRPKPPSINKQAIDALEASLRNGYIKAEDGVIILRALESLPDPQD